MPFTPNLFLSHMRSKDGPAKPSRFEVIIPVPPYIDSFIGNSLLTKILNFPNSIFSDVTDAINVGIGRKTTSERGSNPTMSRYLALQCETAEIPGRTLLTQDAKIYGPGFKVPYQSQYGEMQLQFISTNEFWERKLFEKWLEAIHPSDTNNLRFPKMDGGFQTQGGYLTQIKIIQYDDFIKQIYAVELVDAFPIGMAAQPLSWSDDNFHRLSIQIAYQRYKPIYEGTFDLAAASAALFGAGLSRVLPLGRAL